MPRFILTNPRLTLLLAFIALIDCFCVSAEADQTTSLAQTKGKSGAFAVTLEQRSPLSKPAEILKRVALAVKDQGSDYDLSKEVFDLYVPKEPDGAGKYGLMVMQSFKEYGRPPDAWPAVLDKYHMIWMAARNSGDGRAAVQKMGLLLDQVHNAQAAFSIDDRRIFFCPISPTPPTSGMALYFPDVFAGALYSIQWHWYADIREANTILKGQLPRPDEKSLALARRHGRFVLAMRQNEPSGKTSQSQVVFTQGYKSAGFQNAQLFAVPLSQMEHYDEYAADWFDKAVALLDAPLTGQAAAKSDVKPSVSTDSKPSAPSSGTNPPTPDAAARALALAKSYISANRYDVARQRLDSIIKTYPDSPAAAEAKTLLQQIQGK